MTVRDFIGTKYTIHGRSLEEGLDCYGVIYLYFKALKGIELPDPFYDGISREEKAKVGEILINGIPATRIEQLEKDCIVYFKTGGKLSHIGVYLGDGMILHSTKATGCVISNIQRYNNLIDSIYKVGVQQGQK